MIYIDTIYFPRAYQPGESYNYESLSYPNIVFVNKNFREMICKEITILYGNNGSGKSTILNLIGEKIGVQRNKPLYKNKEYVQTQYGMEEIPYFDDFLEEMSIKKATDELERKIELPSIRKLISSEDVFKLANDNIKHNNNSIIEIEEAREKKQLKREGYYFNSLDDYDRLVQWNEARKTSEYQYAKKHSSEKKKINSNGETALEYFNKIFESDGLYLIDEPENCLSPIFQIELMKIINECAKYCNCQFIIATHSPLILSLPNAVIYDLDASPVMTSNWYNLPNVKLYFDFFYMNKDKFGK